MCRKPPSLSHVASWTRQHQAATLHFGIAPAMSTHGTKCPFCRHRYVRASAYEKHLQSRHLELHKNFYKAKPDVSRFRPHSADSSEYPTTDQEVLEEAVYPAGVNQSDYESSDSEEHPSDGEENLTLSSSNAGSRVDAYKDAGRPLKNMHHDFQFEAGLMNDPWRPFQSLDDFKLAKWFITSKVPRSRIDEYFSIGLSKSSSPCFRSAYKLDQYIKALDPYQHLLTWNEGTFSHDDHSSTFFYRNIVHCVEYLLAQPAYREDIVYAPVREYGNGERLYSEMHTADWWWETQVRVLNSSSTRRCKY